jgi:hypothetical protein
MHYISIKSTIEIEESKQYHIDFSKNTTSENPFEIKNSRMENLIQTVPNIPHARR